MSRARKGLRAPTRKAHKTKVNPRRRMRIQAGGTGEIWATPTPAEAEELEALFGPTEGRIVAVGMSDNLKL